MPGGVGGARASLASTRFEAAAGGDLSQSGQHAPCGRANLPPTLHRRLLMDDRPALIEHAHPGPLPVVTTGAIAVPEARLRRRN